MSEWEEPEGRDQLIAQLARKGTSRDGWLEYLRFPYFRNLAAGTRVDFGFPYTVLLGSNGSGKSSTLHALYGSLEGKNVSHYWFETEVDRIQPIREGLENSVVSGFRRDGATVECLKLRRFRAREADYWETEHALVRYGMSLGEGGVAARHKPLAKHCVYLDFRGELSAFDKCYYFLSERKLSQIHEARKRRARVSGATFSKRHKFSRQDFIRERSAELRALLDGRREHVWRPQHKKSGVKVSGKRQPKNERVESLEPKEVAALSWILGKSYSSGKILRHSLYGDFEGRTVWFVTSDKDGLNYSEAFAGSGEVSAAMLVHDVSTAPPESMILLDEPEVSLHPAAQQRLQRFLLDAALRKGHQIVLATHSPEFARGLPQTAIKVFLATEAGGVRISSQHSAAEALDAVGSHVAQLEVYVEDEALRILVTAAITAEGAATARLFDVRIAAGGVQRIHEAVAQGSAFEWGHRCLVLDGDARPPPYTDVESMTTAQLKDSKFLAKELKKAVNWKHNPTQKQDIAKGLSPEGMVDVIRILSSSRFFIPGTCPEQLVWSAERAESLLYGLGTDAESARQIVATAMTQVDPKLRIKAIADAAGGAMTWDGVYRQLVTAFLNCDSPERVEMRELVLALRARCTA